MKAVAIILLLLAACASAHARPEPWMRKADPNTLHSIVFVDEKCPFSDDDARKIVNGVLIRSRLRTGDYLTSGETFGIVVMAACMKTEGARGLYVYSIDIRFVSFVGGQMLLSFDGYGGFGISSRNSMELVIKDGVEDLLVDYLQANLDLTPE